MIKKNVSEFEYVGICLLNNQASCIVCGYNKCQLWNCCVLKNSGATGRVSASEVIF